MKRLLLALAPCLLASCLLASCLLASCGYHVAGRADLIPKNIKTVCIPAFGNITTRYKLTDRLPEAISHEFIARTRYRIVSDPNAADAVLRGGIVNYIAYTTTVDPVTGRATAAEIHVVMNVTFTERATGKVLFSNPNFEVRERYQVSVDPKAYFEESDSALNRVAQQVARQLVTSILEKF
jgi:outer membrane lipopolysaccharide assembly protein LptE/RlpB